MQVFFKNQPTNLVGKQLELNQEFPEFKAVDINMDNFDSSIFKNKKRLVFSIPSIDTGVCEIETAKFLNYFKGKQYPVLVISQDLPFAFKRWCAGKDNDAITTLSDFRFHDFASKTGTLLENIGLLTRAVFVVDENNKIVHLEYCSNVSNEPNYEEIFKFFK
ncbi:thiol peroxidase [Mycoplasmopsis adleri]|uniref:thiol peroxidase n=1 Tax=Mycoplasmopsis adleri TaxID=51362 RepID=UPI0038739909